MYSVYTDNKSSRCDSVKETGKLGVAYCVYRTLNRVSKSFNCSLKLLRLVVK